MNNAKKGTHHHKPIWITSRQAFNLYEFLEDFQHEFNKYSGQATTILIALKKAIPDIYFED
jgi:hypothetical protein